jgi:transcription initiation factor TFIIH subunit 3
MPFGTSYTFVTFLVQQNVALDVCSLDQELGLLQQGCDITGGLYLRIPQLQGLLQYLLVMQADFWIR